MNVLEIKILKQPTAGMRIRFRLQTEAVALYAVDYPMPGFVIGATVAQTAVNLADDLNFIASGTGSPVTFTAVGTSVFANYSGPGYVSLTMVIRVLDYIHLYHIDPEALGFDAFNIDVFTIEIIDTYENTRTLVEHFAPADSLGLTWDGGDALYQPMMVSRLDFSMQVPGGADGYFLHLLTGDEKRYLVKLRNIDADGVVRLLWQGFILPDTYREPYKSGAVFVEFTAVDMLGSLKGKVFKPWFYENYFTLPELLGYLLAETGLQQEMYIKHSLVNIGNTDWHWRYSGIYLTSFTDGKKYDDLYAILEAVLNAQGLQILSFRGKWIVQGFTRRQESTGLAEVYYHDGVYKDTVTVAHEAVAPLFNTVPQITADSPYSRVAVGFEADTNESLFPEDVFVRDYTSTTYYYGGGIPSRSETVENDLNEGYVDMYNAYWSKVGLATLTLGFEKPYFYYYPTLPMPSGGFNIPESSALVNYMECSVKPYVVGGRRYEIEMEVNASITLDALHDDAWMEARIKEGQFDKLFCFQLFIDDIEFMSNRPGFPLASLYRFTIEARAAPYLAGGAYHLTMKFNWEFTIPKTGRVTLRVLPPLGATHDYNVLYFWVYPQVLKFSNVGEIKDIESVLAVRNISSTVGLDTSVKLTCSVDTSVSNNINIANRPFDRYLSIPVEREGFSQFNYFHNYDDLLPIELFLTRWPVSSFVRDYVFNNRLNKSVFLERASGTLLHYFSLFSKNILGVYYMAAYHGFDAPYGGQPKLPKDYAVLPLIQPNDKLSVMVSILTTENVSNRAQWKIYGFSDGTVQTYVKTMAYAFHCVRPTTLFSIDATALQLLFPLQRIVFRYLDQNRFFLPVRYKLNLFKGKTELTMKEAILTPLTDVIYE